MFATSSFLSGAAHTRVHADEQQHFMTADHHTDHHDHSHDMSDQSDEEERDLDHKDHPAELHFVALDIAPPEGVSEFDARFVRLTSLPPDYSGPLQLKEPDPERLPA